MNKLWAPWRKKYIRAKQTKKCIFCVSKTAGAGYDLKKLIVERSEHSFCMLNAFPYNNGHIMVAPYRHVPSLEYLTDKEILDVISLVNKMKVRMDKRFAPKGFNIGVNIGRTAGAGIPGHIHVHIVPRWEGDTNFMPVLGSTKVISESLESVYRVLGGNDAEPRGNRKKRR